MLFGFNTLGYYLYTTVAMIKANRSLEARLDIGNYSASELIKIQVPLCLPYTNDWTKAERVDGNFKYNGQVYKYVKRIFTNGVMTYWCIPHNIGKYISQNATDYFGKVNGLPGAESQKKSAGIKKSFTDFVQDKFLDYEINFILKHHFSSVEFTKLNDGFLKQLEHPPSV